MVRLGQGRTTAWERLALLGCGGSREQFLLLLTVLEIDKTTTKVPSKGVLMVGHFILLPRQYLLGCFFSTE
jgi:hypothetical protein